MTAVHHPLPAHAWPRQGAAGRLRLTLIGCLLLALAVRPWSLGTLALVALVPLFGVLREERNALAGAAFTAATMFVPALVAYDGIAPLSALLALAAALVGCVPYALVGALAVRLRRIRGPRFMLVCLPIMWCAAESLPAQTWLLGAWASPLLALGYSQFGLPTMQLARIGGVTAVTLCLLVSNAALTSLLWDGTPWPALGLAALAATVALVTFGTPAAAGPALRVRIVQPVLRDAAYAAARYLPAARRDLIGDLVELARPGGVDAAARRGGGDPTARRGGGDTAARPSGGDGRALAGGSGAEAMLGEGRTGAVELTFFPEGAFPGPIVVDAGQAVDPDELEPLLAALGPTLFGAAARSAEGVSNAAFRWDGHLTHVYDKQRLVPLAEANLVAGGDTRVVTLAGARVAPLICFEAAFANLARRAARKGATLLAVLTNDAFASFLGTPNLHLRVAAFRAVETGLPLVFASNAGPSAAIEATGRIEAVTRPRERVTLDATLSLGAGHTLFVRWGDWIGKTTQLLALVLVVLAGAKGGSPLD